MSVCSDEGEEGRWNRRISSQAFDTMEAASRETTEELHRLNTYSEMPIAKRDQEKEKAVSTKVRARAEMQSSKKKQMKCKRWTKMNLGAACVIVSKLGRKIHEDTDMTNDHPSRSRRRAGLHEH